MSSSISSASSAATSAASSASSVASSVFSSATSKASASASAAGAISADESFSYATLAFISLTGIITTLLIIAASVYFAGYGDDAAEWWAKRYYKAKAITEVKVLEHAGIESVENEMKGKSMLSISFEIRMPQPLPGT